MVFYCENNVRPVQTQFMSNFKLLKKTRGSGQKSFRSFNIVSILNPKL